MKEVAIIRIPILDKNKNIYGYEISLKDKENNFLNFEDILEILITFNISKYLENKLIFFSLPESFSTDELLEYSKYFLKDNVIFVLQNSALVEEMELLKIFTNFKFNLALKVKDTKYLKDNFSFYFINKENIDKIKKEIKHKCIIEGIDDKKEIDKLVKEGFIYFKGDFIYNQIETKGKILEPSKKSIIQLFNQIVENYDPNKIEEIMKKNPDLAVNFLKFLNSPFFGFKEKISSIRYGIALAGEKNLKIWLLLFITLNLSQDESHFAKSLLTIGAIRGKIMEELAKYIDGNLAEKAFLVGLFSLLDRVFEIPLEDLISEFSLDKEISEALLKKENILGKLLLIVENIDKGNVAEAFPILYSLGIPAEDLLYIENEAFKWIEITNFSE